MTNPENEIRELEQAWAVAEQAADADALDELSVPEFHLVGPLGFVLTRPQWSQRYRTGDLHTATLDWQVESLHCHGDAVVTVGTHTQTGTYQGQSIDGMFRSTHVAVRRDGRWRLAAIQLSPIRNPAAARPTRPERLVKRLVLPDGAAVPRRLAHGDVVAAALTRDDLTDDVRGINAGMELIRRTRGGEWPTEPVTDEYDYVDLVWHECEFRDGKSFTYVLRDDAGGYLGCCYLYPLGTRTPLSPAIADRDVDVSWWVTPDAYAEGYYRKVYTALRHWFTADLSFWTPHYSNAEIPS